MSYWLISVPTEVSGDYKGREEKIPHDARQRLEDATRDKLVKSIRGLAKPNQFKVPLNLKVGTLDKLMSLSDKLSKMDTIIESVTKKIERSHYEVAKQDPKQEKEDSKQSAQAVPMQELKVKGKSPQEYVERFEWDSKTYNPQLELQVMCDKILQESHKDDEELKKLTAEYTEIKQSLQAIERKETGTLLVKPLGQFVTGENAKYIIEKEWITTFLVVVPKAKEIEFKNEYETLEAAHAEREEQERVRREEEAKKKAAALAAQAKEGKSLKPEKSEEQEAKLESKLENKKKDLCPNVVPGSAKKLTPEDYEGEFALYRILVLKKGEDLVKTLLREKRYTVRPFKYDPKEEKKDAEEKGKLLEKRKSRWNKIVQWTRAHYDTSFSSWIHLKAIRVFVESVLRYGLPVLFTATIIEPERAKDAKIRQVLRDLYKSLPNAALAEAGEGEIDASLDKDFFPYVYFGLNVLGTQ